MKLLTFQKLYLPFTQCVPPNTNQVGWKVSKLVLLGEWISKITGGQTLRWRIKNNWWGCMSFHTQSFMVPNGSGIPRIACIFFGTGNVLEKIQFFMLVLEMFLKSEILTINILGYNILVGPCLNLLYVIKYYFNSAQSNLNNRSNHQVTVGPNWNWMRFSKLRYLLDTIYYSYQLLLLLITFLYSEIKITLKQELCHLW